MQATYPAKEIKRLINGTLKAINDAMAREGYNSRIEQTIKLKNMLEFVTKLPTDAVVTVSLEDMTCIRSRPSAPKSK